MKYRNGVVFFSLFAIIFIFSGIRADAQDGGLPSGDELVKKVNDRDDGVSLYRHLAIELTDKHGKVRKQETITYRKYFGEEKRSAFYYTSPSNIKDTAFLTYDYPEADKDDDQWLYLPALRRVRRISASNRGDYFLGTDFTYEDIKLDTRLSAVDYTWTTTGETEIDGHHCFVIEGIPVDEKTKKELGYSRSIYYIDSEIFMSRKTEAFDVNGNPLKTVLLEDIQQIQGIWSSLRMIVRNQKTKHSTLFLASNLNYETEIDDDMFTERALKRGVSGR